MNYHFEHIAMFYWHRYMTVTWNRELKQYCGERFCDYKDLSGDE